MFNFNSSNLFEGATKFYFMHYSCVVIILFITDLYKFTISTYYFEKTSFLFCVFCLICFELAVIFIDFYNIFIIIIYKGNKCSVILFSPKVIMKTVLVKTCFQRSYLLAKYENQRNIFHVEHGCLLLAQKYSSFGGHSIITIP